MVNNVSCIEKENGQVMHMVGLVARWYHPLSYYIEAAIMQIYLLQTYTLSEIEMFNLCFLHDWATQNNHCYNIVNIIIN